MPNSTAWPCAELEEDKGTHELRFVAAAAGTQFGDVAQLYIADRLARRYGLNDATIFALLSQRIPPSLTAAIAELPDAGLDDEFTAQGTRRHSLAFAYVAREVPLPQRSRPTPYPPHTPPHGMRSSLGLMCCVWRAWAPLPDVRGKTPQQPRGSRGGRLGTNGFRDRARGIRGTVRHDLEDIARQQDLIQGANGRFEYGPERGRTAERQHAAGEGLAAAPVSQ